MGRATRSIFICGVRTDIHRLLAILILTFVTVPAQSVEDYESIARIFFNSAA